MGFLSGIGKAIGKVAGIASNVSGIASGIGAVGGLLGSGVDDERDFASAQAAAANAFTEKQLKNRHQWEVEDLRKAGLNPILSAMKGAPSIGGSAQAVATPSSGSEFANYASSAAAANQQRLNTEKLKSEIDLLEANATAAKTQGVKNLAEAKNTGNIGNITQNLGNVASGFHGLTSNAAAKVKQNLNDLWNIGDIWKKAVEKNRSEGKYDFFKRWQKGN